MRRHFNHQHTLILIFSCYPQVNLLVNLLDLRPRPQELLAAWYPSFALPLKDATSIAPADRHVTDKRYRDTIAGVLSS